MLPDGIRGPTPGPLAPARPLLQVCLPPPSYPATALASRGNAAGAGLNLLLPSPLPGKEAGTSRPSGRPLPRPQREGGRPTEGLLGKGQRLTKLAFPDLTKPAGPRGSRIGTAVHSTQGWAQDDTLGFWKNVCGMPSLSSAQRGI